ncbi:LacI family DNA-binding transcriptional regulator [Paenibacillus swuensis]|uniref:LacI family DNA-binding transcriptional regulator n=1 Tax=Paenibacillus swuensis TaxID=1178515 RepID=UPI000B0E177E
MSRVLNSVGPIAEKTRDRVLAAAKELNYHPSALAKNFVKRKSGNIGVILPYVPKVHIFSTYYFSEILSGVGEAVKQHGYDLLLLFTTPQEGVMNYSLYFQTQKVDACIILGARDTLEEREALEDLERNGYPFCLVNQRFEGSNYNGVDADHVQGSYEAVQYLLQQGAREIGFVNGPTMYSNSRDRLQGYRKALDEAGVAFRTDLLYEGNYSRKSGEALARVIAEQVPRPDAVFAANDRMAIGLLQGWKAIGLEAGRDIALIGYDNSDTAKVTDPPLTSVDVPFFEMGRQAVQLLMDEMSAVNELSEEHSKQRIHLLPTKLVVRRSSQWDHN